MEIPLLKSDGVRQEEQGFDLKGMGFDQEKWDFKQLENGFESP